MIQGRKPSQHTSFSPGFSVVVTRRGTVIIKSAGEPVIGRDSASVFGIALPLLYSVNDPAYAASLGPCGDHRVSVDPARDQFLFLGPMSPSPSSFRSGRRIGERSSAPRRESSAGPIVLQCRVSIMVYDEINDESTVA